MKTTFFYATLLPLLAASGLAADGDGDSSIVCRTEMGSTSVSDVETDTTTKTRKIAPTTTITVNPTVTKQNGRWSTITKLATKTFTVTGKADTDTFTTTTTLFKVATVTVSATATITTTKTGTETSTSTTQVPTTAGFKPISDTINSDALPLKRRKAGKNPHARPKVKAGLRAMSFPSEVHCTKLLPNTTTQTVRKTGDPTTITISTLQSTTITTTISTTTTLIPDDVSVTKTTTTTMSVSTFSTTWKTKTNSATATKTKVLSGPTVFAACSEDNVFGPNFNSGGTGYYVSNVANNGPGIPSDFQVVANGADDAGECCTACQQFNGCETWIFRARNRNCFLLYHAGATCKSQINHPNFFMSKKGSDTGSGYVVGNGNCGFTYSGNSDGSVFSVDV